MLSQATNGDTSAIAVAAAAALFSSGLDKDSTDKAAKELHVDPSTSAVLSSVLNGPVRGVLNSTLGRSATGWSASCDALKAVRSESASPASSVAVNEHHGNCELLFLKELLVSHEVSTHFPTILSPRTRGFYKVSF